MLGAGGELAGGALAPAAVLGASYGAERTGFAVSARALVTASRDEPLEPGRVSWRRWPLAVGPTLRLATSSVVLAFSAGPAVGWLHLGGDAFDRVSARDGVVWGGFAEALVSGQARPLTLFGALSAQVYPGKTTAYVSGLELQWDLPKAAVSVALGVQLSP